MFDRRRPAGPGVRNRRRLDLLRFGLIAVSIVTYGSGVRTPRNVRVAEARLFSCMPIRGARCPQHVLLRCRTPETKITQCSVELKPSPGLGWVPGRAALHRAVQDPPGLGCPEPGRRSRSRPSEKAEGGVDPVARELPLSPKIETSPTRNSDFSRGARNSTSFRGVPAYCPRLVHVALT